MSTQAFGLQIMKTMHAPMEVEETNICHFAIFVYKYDTNNFIIFYY